MASAYLTVNHLSTKDLTRIFSKISIKPDVQWNGTPCWNWTGQAHKGYGRIRLSFGDKPIRLFVHRIIFSWLIHPLPVGRKHGELDHLCRNVACCNPIHLEFVTTRENVLRGIGPAAKNAQKTHCIHGHPLSGENLRIVGRRRRCRTCVSRVSKEQGVKHREKCTQRRMRYRAEHREQDRQVQRAWEAKHKEQRLAANRLRYAKDPEKYRAFAHKYYERKKQRVQQASDERLSD